MMVSIRTITVTIMGMTTRMTSTTMPTRTRHLLLRPRPTCRFRWRSRPRRQQTASAETHEEHAHDEHGHEDNGHDERSHDEQARENAAHADDAVHAEHGEHADEHHAAPSHDEHAAADHEHHGDEHHDDEDDGDEAEEEVVESVGGDDVMEEVPERAFRPRRQYKIQEVIKRRQVKLVQVVKEERGNKGAALTTYLSLAGRYAVLMPNTARGGGISRKITSAQDRSRLKEVVQDLDVPEGMGIILRTAGASRTKPEIKRDFEYLIRMWETVRDMTLKSQAPTLVYEEGSLIKRSLRDLYNKEIDEIQVAGEAGYQEARDFMKMLMPSNVRAVSNIATASRCSRGWGSKASSMRCSRRPCNCAPAATS